MPVTGSAAGTFQGLGSEQIYIKARQHKVGHRGMSQKRGRRSAGPGLVVARVYPVGSTADAL